MELMKNGEPFFLVTSPHGIESYLPSIGDVYLKSGWGTAYSLSMLRKMFRGAYYVVAISSVSVMGFIRAFTDGVCVTHLSEILVHPDYRGKGVGEVMMKKMLGDLSHTTMYAEVMRGRSERFFEKNEFSQKMQLRAYARKKQI
ncbi:MAG: GNAT family N-acetyltransferase [Comamonadaceae bacterium]|nr:GNAT family N-acetyltransferase [Comamonadaceae bacterium]